MKEFKLILALLTLIAISAFGQVPTTPEENAKDKQKPYIEVIGVVEKEIMPDEIYLVINIRERVEGKDVLTIEKQETSLKGALPGIGVSSNNLTRYTETDYITLNLWDSYDAPEEASYQLKLGDTATVTKTYKKLNELKVAGAYISHVNHSKIEELRKEMRIQAIKSAKEQAEYLLEAIGEKPGKPLVVYEMLPKDFTDDYRLYRNSLDTPVDYIATTDRSYFVLPKDNDPEPYLGFQKIHLVSKVYVKFEIK